MTTSKEALPLKDYIQKHFAGNKTDFAKAINTTRQHVYLMENSGYIVYEGRLFSPRSRTVPKGK